MNAFVRDRPVLLRMADLAGRFPPLVSRTRLDATEVIKQAVAATGRHDFGPTDAWRHGLDILVDSLRREADLTPAGRFFARGQLENALRNRLLIEAEIAGAPDLLSRPIDAPIVLLGLPRTGSTLLQTLLSLDPDNRSLWHWEAAAPAPAPHGDLDADDPRVAGARRAVALVDRLAPEAGRLHPVGADRPTECVTLFVNSFASLELACINWVPSYLQWCLATDMAPHYDYYVRQLQVLQRHNHRARWVLKSPAHLFFIPQLARVFPNARLVQLHRDPAQVLASYFQLVMVLSRIGNPRLDPRRIGPLWTAVWANAVHRADAARRSLQLDVVDVEYRRLVADPVGTVHEIYEQLGLRVGVEFGRRLHSHVAHDRYASGRRGELALEYFGVTERQVRAAFDQEAGDVAERSRAAAAEGGAA